MQIKGAQTDIFDFKLVDTFYGYNSAADKTRLPAGWMIRGSKNVYKTILGTIANRPGIKLRGSISSTNAGVKSSYEWATSVGTFRALRVCNGKLEVESDIVSSGTYVWYELKETSTIASLASVYTRFVFDTWWDNLGFSDRLVMVRGDSNLFHWSGGVAVVSAASTDSITLAGTKTWAELGFATYSSSEKKIIIDGREFTYTGGESTTTLTGVTASSGTVDSLTSGMVAIQSVISVAGGSGRMFPASFDADFIISFGNQVSVGSYLSKVVYQSADVTVTSGAAANIVGCTNFQNVGDHVAGDPDTITLDTFPKGFGQEDGKLVIFAGINELYLIEPNVNVTFSYTGSDGASRLAYNKVTKKILPSLNSALGHEFIGNLNGNIVWLDQKQQLRAYGAFSQENFIKPVHLSLAVKDELSEDDFTGGHLKVIEGTVYITAPNNARDWMYEVRERLNDDGSISTERIWQSPQIRGISRFAVIDGVIYGHSNVNPQLYQIWDTGQWFDDHPSGEAIPYTSVMRLSYQNHGRPEGRIKQDMIYYEGFMPNGTELLSTLYFEYQGARGTRDLVVNNDEDPAKFYSGLIAPSLGDSSLGDNPLGDGILQESSERELVPKFRTICNIPNTQNCFEYSIDVYSTEIDARWEISRLGPNTKFAEGNATFLRKS